MPNEMVETPRFIPTAENTYVISYPSHGSDYPYDFAAILAQSRRCEREGDVERACNLQYDGIKKLIDLIPDEDEIWLDWEDRGNQAVLELLKGSAIDHFLVGDFEMAAGLFEMELDMDPEDHLEATKPLAYCYVALGEYESFDEIVDDISDKYPEKEILKLWSEFRRTGRLPSGEMIHFRKRKSLAYLTSPIVVILICIVSPVNGTTRYMLPAMIMMPLMVAFTLDQIRPDTVK
mgnify:CR=1 FL=1